MPIPPCSPRFSHAAAGSLLLLTLGVPTGVHADPSTETDVASRIESLFKSSGESGYEGCFLVADLTGKVLFRSGETCAEPYSPCSTFKIPNSLIGLEVGAVTPDEVMKWDGKPKYFKAWQQDHGLASAMTYSVVWYYQELARRVGNETMQRYVDRFDYGNRDLSSGIDTFWLGESLSISADEQLVFLEKFWSGRLPIAPAHVRTVKDVLPSEEGEHWQLRAKTGSCRLETTSLGWWVGHARRGETERLFVTRITGQGAEGRKARELTRTLLADPTIATALLGAPIPNPPKGP